VLENVRADEDIDGFIPVRMHVPDVDLVIHGFSIEVGAAIFKGRSVLELAAQRPRWRKLDEPVTALPIQRGADSIQVEDDQPLAI